MFAVYHNLLSSLYILLRTPSTYKPFSTIHHHDQSSPFHEQAPSTIGHSLGRRVLLAFSLPLGWYVGRITVTVLPTHRRSNGCVERAKQLPEVILSDDVRSPIRFGCLFSMPLPRLKVMTRPSTLLAAGRVKTSQKGRRHMGVMRKGWNGARDLDSVQINTNTLTPTRLLSSAQLSSAHN